MWSKMVFQKTNNYIIHRPPPHATNPTPQKKEKRYLILGSPPFSDLYLTVELNFF